MIDIEKKATDGADVLTLCNRLYQSPPERLIHYVKNSLAFAFPLPPALVFLTHYENANKM